MDISWIIAHWFQSVICLIVSIVCWRIVYKEFIRYKATWDEHVAGNVYQRRLHRLSLATLIVSSLPMTILPFEKIGILCKWMRTIWQICYFQGKFMITFYQISRLQYTFAKDQIYSKYGYSKSWFRFLYSFGIIGLFPITIYQLIELFWGSWTLSDKIRTCDTEPTAETQWISPVIAIMAIICYAVWDWTILSCYIIKICQFYKKTDNIHSVISTRIKFIMHKITFLTFFLEFAALTTVILNWYLIINDDIPVPVVCVMVAVMDFESLLSVYMVYLMIEHNSKEYINFVKIMDKIGIFFCCTSFVDIALSMDVEDQMSKHVQDQQKRKNTNIDTRTTDGLPEPIAMVSPKSIESRD